MKKMWKRFVSLLLACTLLAGMLPLSASAQATAPGKDSDQYKYAKGILDELNGSLELSEEYTLSGPFQLKNSEVYIYELFRTIQDDSGHRVTDTRYVIVPGEGATQPDMPDYENGQDGQPWAESNPSAVYIADGVTGIGNHAFNGMSTLETIEFENSKSLTKVGEYAFNNCDKMVGLSLDLSNVTTLGKYAFNGCERLGSGENNKGVTLSDALTTIPENAFNTCGLKNVNIPKSCTKIEKNAFAHNSLSEVGELVLPNGLVTIGESAFVVTMGSGETGIGITSLTIPSSVESIGANAFSGRRNLQTVTVKDDGKEGAQLTLGDGAFGRNEFTAYSTTGSFTDKHGTTYTGLMGTVFHLPEDLVEKFINGQNCYTGSIEPMRFIKTVEPTCEEQGYHLYETTMEGIEDDEGKPVTLQYKQWIDALGHDWDEENLVTVLATCETPSYTYEPCTHGCGEINIINPNVMPALGHDYQVNENGGVGNPGIKESNNAPTTVTYTCQHFKEGEENLHDGSLLASYTWSIPATTLRATTSDTLADLQLPSVTGDTQAYLQWDDSVNKDTKLEEGTRNYQVKLVVSNDSNFQPYTDDSFTIEVRVEKTKLDFSDVHFENSTRWIGGNTPKFRVEGMPEGTSEVKTEYKKKGDPNAEWTTEKPAEDTADDTGEYLVRYTFKYEPKIYVLVTDDPDLLPPDGYDLEKTKKNGEGTITGDYRVAQMTMEDVSIRAIDNLTFNGTSRNIEGEAQPTVQLEGVLLGSKVTFSWTENGETKEESIPSTTSSTFSGASITNAGTYEITVRVENGEYAPVEETVTVTIAKQTLPALRAESNLRYDTTEKTGVPDSTDGRYTVSDNKQTNAGTYTAKATVINPSNYQWPASVDPDNNGTAEISWQILHRLLAKPTIPISQYQYEEGTYRQPVTTTSQDIAISYEDDKLVATFRGQTAYTATNAKETNAEDYTVTVHLENQNYRWADQTSADFTLNWTINPLQINAPTITAPDAAYDGVPYDGEVTLKHSSVSGSNGSSEGIIDLENTQISYYTTQNGGEPLQSAPINVRDYYAGVQNWAFVDGKVETNYQIIRGARDPFSITKATATMTFSPEEVTKTYTAGGTPLQKVTVSGLQGDDATKTPTEIYSVTYTYKYRESSTTAWENVTETTTIDDLDTFVFMDVGQYQITAKWGAGTVSNNYTATDATYTLTIKKAEDQSITLTPDKEERWTEAIDQTPAKYTITYGEAATFAVIGKAALDNASISYEVKDGSDVVRVDSGNGTVTIKQAGEATITVTAADTDNVKGTSVEYTVTVKKAKPVLELDAGTAAYTGSEVAEDTYKKATLSGAGEEYAQPDKEKLEYYFYTYDEDGQDTILADTDHSEALATPSSVGTYWLKVVFPGDACYSDAVTAAKFTITPAELSVSATGHTGTYDGTEYPAIKVNSVTGNDSNLSYEVYYMKDDGTDAPAAENEGWSKERKVKDVADSGKYWYKVVITGEHANDYAPYIASAQVTISAKELQLTGVRDAYTKTYDGDNDVETDLNGITVTGIATEPISVTATGTYDNENAGKDKTVTLTLTLSGTDGANIDWGNYSYNDQALTDGQITLTKAGAGTITPKAITVTGISAVNRVYDGTKVVQLTGEPKTEDTLFNEDGTVSLALAEGAKGQLQDATAENGKAVSVGNDAVEITGEGSGNYSVTVSLPKLTVDIEKATPTVTITGASDNKLTVAYTGNPVNIAATVAGISDTDKPTGEVTFRSYESAGAAQNDTTGTGGTELEEMPSNGGPYYLRAFIAEDTNYKAAVSDYVELVIDATALSVTTGEPAEKPYTGKEHNMAQWADMKVQFSGKDVQYDVVFLKKGENETSAPDAEDEKWNSGVSAITNVAESGEYWYKVTAKEGEGNFNPHVSTSAITFTVTPATLTLSSSLTKEKEYDGTTAAVVTGQKVTGAQSGENITVSSVSAAYDNANVGTGKTITTTYKVTFGVGVTPGNYIIGNSGAQTTHNDDGTWTVTTKDTGSISAKSITVTIADKNKIYDGQAPSVTSDKGTDWTVDAGALCSQNGTVDELRVVLSVESDGNSAVGTYAITGEWTNKNYDVTFTGNWQGEEGDPNNKNAGTYTITPRPIKVEIGDAEGFYGDAPVKPSGLLKDISTEDGEGLVKGDSLDQFLDHVVINASPNTDVGSHYTITGTSGEYGNYNVTFASGTYTVKQRPITITIEDHSSKYGAEINGGIAKPVSGTDYTVAITGNATTGDAIVKGDNLEIKLTTEATADSPVDDYDITGSAAGEKVNNYAITWAGSGTAIPEKPGQNYGKYTIDKAGLKVEFNHHDKVLNGVSINITDSYKDNPLVLKNASTDTVVSAADKESLTITYSIAAAGENGGDTDVATINAETGEVTILKTGTVRITATVTPQDNSNYTGTQTTWYELNIISGGQMTLMVTPKTNLAYTGEPQELIETPICSLDSAKIQYSLDNQKWEETIPTGTNAGTYTVYVKATDPLGRYSEVTEHVTVTIDKADLKGRFAQEEYTHVLTTGTSYDSATANPLTITSKNYDANPANYTYYSDNMKVASSANGTSTIVITGTAGESATIRVTVPGDNNYNEGTFTYKLKISNTLSEIKYNITGATTTYNGQPQTIAVNVTEPASGATVMYWNESTNAYDQTEPPAYTNVQEGGYPIKFQITAPGYEIEEGTATLTINPKDISQCQVEGIAASYTFVNKPIEPQTVEVVDGSVILTKNTDYTLEYGANQEVGEDTGTVTIKGKGNYTGKVIEHFDIIPVDGSSGMTASIDPAYDTYNSSGNTATVTVTHQTGSESHNVDLTAANAEYTISATDLVTGQTITDHGATGTGGTLTFTKPAIYDITLTLTGDHQGEFHLSYTLLPLSNDDGGLTLTVDDETQKVFTYGGEIDPSDATIKVTANNTDVTDQCTLTYVYTPFEGTPTTTASPYTAEVLENAGVYTVTATPTDGSAITGTGTFTFLILQRDLSKATLAVEDDNLVYNQVPQEPDVTVTVDGNAQPTKDADYTVTYYNNVNASDDGAKAVVTATGNNFTGSNTENFSIAPKKITAEMVKEIPEQYYTGSAVIPPVTITDGEYTLILGYDYTTACDAIGPGTATVTIEGKGNYTSEVEKTFTITSGGAPAPTNQFDLTVTPNQWTWEDDLTGLDLSVTFGEGTTLTLGTNYTLNVKGGEVDQNFTGGADEGSPVDFIKSLKPGTYTITATGTNAYKDSKDTETVTVKKIQPELTVTAAPETLSGGGKVTLTLKGEKLPAFAEGQDLSSLLTASAKDEKNAPDLSELEWETDEQTGVMTAELTLPNTSETYTFTLTFTGNEYYEAATASEQVVVAQQIISGGGGGPVEDQPANPDDTGVSDWLNTKEHLAYLAGYPGGIFGPDQNMTRAEAAQMFYNLLLEKDVEITVEFEDVPADAWYAKPVNTLASLGILSGVGNGRFDPERSITRAEFTVIAMKFANTSGGGVNIFSDVNEDDWFYSAVVDSTQYGWINGYPDGTFRPEATISRAEVTVIVNHMLGRAADRPYVIAHEEELNTFGDVNRGHWGYFHVAEATNAHEYHTEDGTESWTGLS